jgi:FkbM family methyltransferase
MISMTSLDATTGLWLRDANPVDNTLGDVHVVAEQRAYELLPIAPDDTVLDVGAHVGAFTRLIALPRGASCVVCVEPDPENLALLHRNVDDEPAVTVLEGAVVNDDRPVVELYRNRRASTMHTTVPTRGRDAVQVTAYAFADLLSLYSPEVVKMDIEGGEYALMDVLMELPACVLALAIEVHPYKGDRQRDKSRDLLASFERQFRTLRAAKVTESNWITQGVYSRRP